MQPDISKFKTKGFEIFLVTQGDEGDIAFVRDNRLLEAGLNVVLDPSGAAFNAYRIQFIPTTFFVDRSGVLRKVTNGWLGDDSLREFRSEVDFLTSN